MRRWWRQRKRGRCGKSEEAHGIMKEDFSGGKLPSGDFGENAAWWWIMIIALNLNEAMKRLVLGGVWVAKRMKAIRFALICIPAWVRERAGPLRVRLSQRHPSLQILVGMRQKIMALAEASRESRTERIETAASGVGRGLSEMRR